MTQLCYFHWFNSIKHGLTMLQNVQADAKSSKKSLKVSCSLNWYCLEFVHRTLSVIRIFIILQLIELRLHFPGCGHREWIWEATSYWCYTTKWYWCNFWWHWSLGECKWHVEGAGDASFAKARIVLQRTIDKGIESCGSVK